MRSATAPDENRFVMVECKLVELGSDGVPVSRATPAANAQRKRRGREIDLPEAVESRLDGEMQRPVWYEWG